MARSSIADLQRQIAVALNALPEVFSTVQWGGRAYKLPRLNGSRRKPRLLAHVWLTRSGDAVGVDFKLEKQRAIELVKRNDWLKPHSFRTLAPSGWVTAKVRTKRAAASLIKLLRESHRLHASPAASALRTPATARTVKRSSASAEALRIERVMREKEAEGWSPRALG